MKAPPQKRIAVIRVESVETQDQVSEPQGPKGIMEELRFIPSAVSEPRLALHMCDNKCNKEGFKFYQFAAALVEDGGASHTINLCKSCYSEMRMKRGERKVTAARWREMIEQKAFRGELWLTFGMEHLVRRMWEHLTIKKSVARSVLVDVEKER